MWAFPERGKNEERVTRVLHWFDRVGSRSACKLFFLAAAVQVEITEKCTRCQASLSRKEFKDGRGQ